MQLGWNYADLNKQLFSHWLTILYW